MATENDGRALSTPYIKMNSDGSQTYTVQTIKLFKGNRNKSSWPWVRRSLLRQDTKSDRQKEQNETVSKLTIFVLQMRLSKKLKKKKKRQLLEMQIKTTLRGTWVAQSVKQLPSPHVRISGSCSIGRVCFSLRAPTLPLCSCSKKQINVVGCFFFFF